MPLWKYPVRTSTPLCCIKLVWRAAVMAVWCRCTHTHTHIHAPVNGWACRHDAVADLSLQVEGWVLFLVWNNVSLMCRFFFSWFLTRFLFLVSHLEIHALRVENSSAPFAHADAHTWGQRCKRFAAGFVRFFFFFPFLFCRFEYSNLLFFPPLCRYHTWHLLLCFKWALSTLASRRSAWPCTFLFWHHEKKKIGLLFFFFDPLSSFGCCVWVEIYSSFFSFFFLFLSDQTRRRRCHRRPHDVLKLFWQWYASLWSCVCVFFFFSSSLTFVFWPVKENAKGRDHSSQRAQTRYIPSTLHLSVACTRFYYLPWQKQTSIQTIMMKSKKANSKNHTNRSSFFGFYALWLFQSCSLAFFPLSVQRGRMSRRLSASVRFKNGFNDKKHGWIVFFLLTVRSCVAVKRRGASGGGGGGGGGGAQSLFSRFLLSVLLL